MSGTSSPTQQLQGFTGGAAMDSDWSGNVGAVEVRELDWAVPAQAEAAGGPFDFVVAADCVYHEQIVESFLQTVMTVTDHRSTGTPFRTRFRGQRYYMWEVCPYRPKRE